MRDRFEAGNDTLKPSQFGATFVTLVNVTPERGNAEPLLVVDEKIEFFGKKVSVSHMASVRPVRPRG